MTVDIATLGIRVDSSQAARAATDLDRMAGAGRNSEASLARMQAQINAILGPLRLMQSLLVSITAALGVRELIQYADTWKLIEGRLRLVTVSAAELAVVQERLFRIARDTRSAYEGTAELYARVARANGMLGRSQADLLRFTELTQMAIQSSGAGAQEAMAGVVQLGQALASGQLRGDELRSVLENLNGVAIELASGMGVTVGQLRRLAEEGKLTSQAIVESLLSREQQIRDRFAALPITVGQAFTVLGNEMLRFVGETDAAFGVTASLSAGILALADNMDVLVAALAGAAAGTVVFATAALPTVADALVKRHWQMSSSCARKK